ncbi:MAG TPA: beta-ketoacyl synthase N-terminal-like domain-containing protein, partial [Kofleriaceae bacterium]|nr:beta-ketoacyl synthase N-terminal-like domain-containing protein [Kofleriaceae bacterium]
MPPVVQPPALARPQAQTPALDNEHLTSAVDAYLKARFATVFKMTTAQLDARVRLDDYGIDSLMIVELHQLLERDLLPLPRTTFFEVPTIAALTELLVTTRADEMRRVLGLASAAASPPPSIASPTIDAPTASSITASIAAPLAAPLAGELRSLVAAHLAIPASDVDLDADLGDLGLEAVDLAHLADALDRRYGTVLPRTTLTARTSLSAIAHALEAAIATVVPDKRGPITVSAITATGITPSPGDDAHDIAIIGLGGRYPMARDLDELWANLRAGRDCVSEIPADRWDQRRYYDPEPGTPGKTYGRWGGFLDEVDRFDPLFFNIAPREAETLDPQERIFLEVAWQALEDAGYARSPIADRSVGVFVGVMYGHYQLHSAEALAAGSGAVAGGSSFASIANRVSYVLDFHGPSIAIDTMCSSSLTAIHLACNAIRTGETAMALAGGVNLSLHPLKYVLLAGGKFLASDGRCRTFGAGGTGYVPGEGAGAVVLKRLDRARADGDRVLGIIKGSALNHGGRTNGFTVPSPTAQAEVIARAVADADIDPSTLSYVEAHGTGTSLGDPIEIAGLARAVGRGRREPCAIGSIKSNLGHLESAAAIAGLTKILLQGAHGELVPSLHAEPANPSIDFAATPFRVQQSTSPWRSVDDRGQPRPLRAGLSSFGAGGSNGHLVVEIEPARPRGARSTTPQILVLSAKNAERLRACAGRLRDHLRATEDDLADIAHSLQISREAMDARLAIVTSTVEDAIAKLTRFLAGAVDAELHEGNARAGHARQLVHGRAGGLFVQALVEDGDLARVASLWVNGCEIEWHRLAPVCWPNGDR